ncbi:hypothetical protein SH1V18_02040 [Vallitalea longa]|uniref:Uncharacterized protein n=1 Tax=Vallitalea longa TaxID=2936439 RepID=A0A9W6DEM0_9FIRM|nr:hypothetical protein [Vallitalea longa]GKX27724.1 hypothetical protein SH1V18_02040 [Vallitalea longa]
MSRSYKKTPALQSKNGSRCNGWINRKVSKAVRKYKHHIPNGSAYKKIYSSYDINEYTLYQPWNNDALEFFESKKEWDKYYHNK